jgi:hypothetical protein
MSCGEPDARERARPVRPDHPWMIGLKIRARSVRVLSGRRCRRQRRTSRRIGLRASSLAAGRKLTNRPPDYSWPRRRHAGRPSELRPLRDGGGRPRRRPIISITALCSVSPPSWTRCSCGTRRSWWSGRPRSGLADRSGWPLKAPKAASPWSGPGGRALQVVVGSSPGRRADPVRARCRASDL